MKRFQKFKVESKLKLNKNRAEDKPRIAEILALMIKVNVLATELSKRVHKERVWTYGDISEFYGDSFKDEYELTSKLTDMVVEKVAQSYRRKKAEGARFMALKPPLKFSQFSSIFVRQRNFHFKESVTLLLPVEGKGFRVGAEFGRYKVLRSEHRENTGTAEIIYDSRNVRPFMLILSALIPAGSPYVEKDLGVERGLISPLFSPYQVVQSMVERKKMYRAAAKASKVPLKDTRVSGADIMVDSLKEIARDEATSAARKIMQEVKEEERALALEEEKKEPSKILVCNSIREGLDGL